MKKPVANRFVFLVLTCAIMTFLIAGCASKTTSDEVAVKPPAEVPAQPEPTVKNTPLPKPAEPDKPVAELEKIYFDYDQYALSPKARNILSNNAEVLKTMSDWSVVIEGHCDNRGSDEYNLALGDRRAQEVKNYLVRLGVSADRIKTNSYGEEMPVDPSSNELAWSKNRRAEFKVVN